MFVELVESEFDRDREKQHLNQESEDQAGQTQSSELPQERHTQNSFQNYYYGTFKNSKFSCCQTHVNLNPCYNGINKVNYKFLCCLKSIQEPRNSSFFN